VPTVAADTTTAARQRVTAGLTAVAPPVFGADSAALSGDARAAVARVAAVLRAEPSVAVSVVGYCADTPGPAEVAQRLSEQRAAVVAAALVTAGVARGRITTVGRGDTAPLATPAASRRVEILVP
jgi:outer membrane protein OmpA-like peptidoglycan-associated protein